MLTASPPPVCCGCCEGGHAPPGQIPDIADIALKHCLLAVSGAQKLSDIFTHPTVEQLLQEQEATGTACLQLLNQVEVRLGEAIGQLDGAYQLGRHRPNLYPGQINLLREMTTLRQMQQACQRALVGGQQKAHALIQRHCHALQRHALQPNLQHKEVPHG